MNKKTCGIGVNLMGPRRKLYHDFEGTLQQMKEMGIKSVEICIAFDKPGEMPEGLPFDPEVFKEMSGGVWNIADAAEKLNQLRAAGIEVVSAHPLVLGKMKQPEKLQELLPILQKFARENSIKYYVISLMEDLSGIKSYVSTLRLMSEELAKDHVRLLYHNHEMECMQEDGTTALDYILEKCPEMDLELDVGWAKFAGQSPVALIEKYQDRIPLLHFKDIREDACAANRSTCFTPIGEGSIPLAEILKAGESCPLDTQGLIIDQDEPLVDILEDLEVGVKNIRKCLKV